MFVYLMPDQVGINHKHLSAILNNSSKHIIVTSLRVLRIPSYCENSAHITAKINGYSI